MTTLFYSPVDASRLAAWNARYPNLAEEARELMLAAEEEELSAAEYAGCLSLRLSEDGRYAFTYPVPFDGTGDPDAFLDRWDAYLLGEELPYVLTETPCDRLPTLRARYRHIESMPLDEEGAYLLVRAVTELEELEELPTLNGERVTLAPLSDGDAAPYAALCRDEETLRYYGYDMRSDAARQTDDAFFLRNARGEWERRRTLPFAIRADGKFVGEILLYGFDAHGGASLAVRLLSDARGRGFARDAVATLLRYALQSLGLLCVRAEVREENTPSLRLFDRAMRRVSSRDGSVFYESGKSLGIPNPE